MGDLFPSIPKSTFASEVEGNWSERVLGLDEYKSDAELAEVLLFKDYPEPLLRFASACCVLFMLVGIPGNLITIIALARCKKVSDDYFCNYLVSQYFKFEENPMQMFKADKRFLF